MFDNTVRKAWICVGIFMHHWVIFFPCPHSAQPFLILLSSFCISFCLEFVLFSCCFPLRVHLSLLSIHCRSSWSPFLLLRRNVAEKLLYSYGFHYLCVCVFGFPSAMAGTGWIHMGGMLQHVCLYCRYLPVYTCVNMFKCRRMGWGCVCLTVCLNMFACVYLRRSFCALAPQYFLATGLDWNLEWGRFHFTFFFF